MGLTFFLFHLDKGIQGFNFWSLGHIYSQTTTGSKEATWTQIEFKSRCHTWP